MSFNPLCPNYSVIFVIFLIAIVMFVCSMVTLPILFIIIGGFLIYLKSTAFCDPTKVFDGISDLLPF